MWFTMLLSSLHIKQKYIIKKFRTKYNAKKITMHCIQAWKWERLSFIYSSQVLCFQAFSAVFHCPPSKVSFLERQQLFLACGSLQPCCPFLLPRCVTPNGSREHQHANPHLPSQRLSSDQTKREITPDFQSWAPANSVLTPTIHAFRIS